MTGDLEALWGLRQVLGETGPGTGLPAPVLERVRELFRADAASCNGMDSRARRHDFSEEATSEGWVESGATDASDPEEVVFWEHYWTSWCSVPERSGDSDSVLLRSDFLGPRAYHSSPMYLDYLRHHDVEHEMLLVLHDDGRGRALRLLLTRGAGPGFTDRDRFLLELLGPHLRDAYARAVALRRGETLTPRQQDVLRLVLGGATNRAIGRRLGISEGTVRTHLQNAYAVLGVSSRTAAAVRAARLH